MHRSSEPGLWGFDSLQGRSVKAQAPALQALFYMERFEGRDDFQDVISPIRLIRAGWANEDRETLMAGVDRLVAAFNSGIGQAVADNILFGLMPSIQEQEAREMERIRLELHNEE